MNPELLERRLSEYGRHLDAQIVPLEGVDVRQLGVKPPARRGWLVAAAAAVFVLVLLGTTTWVSQLTSSDSPVGATGTSTPLASVDATAGDADGAVSVTGHLEGSQYWHGPIEGPGTLGDGRMEMSDERLSGDVTFIFNGNAWEPSGPYLYWGTMLIKNDGGTWEGTHLAADHHARPGVHGPIVMQLTGSGDYAGLSAILYRTVLSPPGTALTDLEESVDGMIFPGDLPPNRN